MFKELIELKESLIEYDKKKHKLPLYRLMYYLIRHDINKLFNRLQNIKCTFDLLIEFCLFYNATHEDINFDQYYIQINLIESDVTHYHILIMNKQVKEYIALYYSHNIYIKHTDIEGDRETSYVIECKDEITDNRTVILDVIKRYILTYMKEGY